MPRHFRIHPAIGVARMGNSPKFYLASETPGLPANSDDGTNFRAFRDEQGQILRQGVRFRVFEYDAGPDGSLSNPREIAVGNDVGDIEWRVHIANRKASFFSFYGLSGADDLYVSRSGDPADKQISGSADDPNDPIRTNLRNRAVASAADRKALLEIDPGEKELSASSPATVELANANPKIPIKSLGTITVDDGGRLIVLGGYGESNSTEVPPRQIDHYANNDTWFDDAGDGSVKARVILKDGTKVDADASWLMVGPPDFAPPIGNVVSLADTLWDTAVREVSFPSTASLTPMMALLNEQKLAWAANGGKSLAGFKPSFTRDIYPLLKRALGSTDVHVSGRYANPEYHKRTFANMGVLSAMSGADAGMGKKLREAVLFYMRNPDVPDAVWEKMPRGLGDDYTQLDKGTPNGRSFLSLTRIQYALLNEWAQGNFFDDWPGTEPKTSPKAAPTPDDLDFSAVENCVGGPFYPGIEVSWLIREKSLYSEPFRLKVPPPPEDPNSPQAPLAVGALHFQPGFFGQQMALPWQADFYDCHKERWYDPGKTEYYFMWWTAQRPDDTFPSGKPKQERWVRALDDPNKTPDENEADLQRFTKMQQLWHQLKFIVVKAGDHYEEEP
jgi:hypothetical protein